MRTTSTDWIVSGRRHWSALLILPVAAMFLVESALAAEAKGGQVPRCIMRPGRVVMQVPKRGFEWLQGEDFQGACDAVPDDGWVSLPSKMLDVFVHTEGPSGSGRYWTITVGVAVKGEKKPARGFCLQTSTVGWRTLQQFGKLPLPWIEDRDRDGTVELLIWDSFPLRAGSSSLAEFGLIAWAYQVDAKGRFAIDWRKTRYTAVELAASYRTTLAAGRQATQALRDAAAQALEDFASGACTAGTMVSPTAGQ
jgi:hypothetical protein